MLIDKSRTYNFQLTALWAFVEVTLGGMLHALRIPLTGVVVGGTAVAIVCIMGRYSKNPWRDIMNATGLVLLVKAGASPHSPPPAYIAVAFQGFLGAVTFQFFRFSRLAVVLFAFLAMLESAFQKLILMTLLYGKSLWTAIDVFVESVLESFRISAETSGSDWLIGIYVGIYAIWGLYLGIRMSNFDVRAKNYIQIWNQKHRLSVDSNAAGAWRTPRNRNLFWLVYLAIILVMSLILVTLGDDKYDLFYVVFRSMSAIFLVFWVINPLFSYWVRKKSKSTTLKYQIQEISNQFAFFQHDYYTALKIVGGYSWNAFRFFKAMELLIAVTMQRENEIIDNE